MAILDSQAPEWMLSKEWKINLPLFLLSKKNEMQRCNAWVSVFLWESSRFHINVVDPQNWEREKLIGIDMYVKIDII